MKFCLLTIVCCCCLQAFCQSATKYYDSNWHEVPKEQAFYQSDFTKVGDSYDRVDYWESSNKIYSTSTYTDMNLRKLTGVKKTYYESGKIRDSIVFDNKGNYKLYDKFFENSKIKMHAFYNEKKHDMDGEMYDSLGNKLPEPFIFQRPAMFPGGASRWLTYLQKNLKSHIAAENLAPVGNYTVIVSFLVMKDGKIDEVEAENNPGYGTAAEAISVIKDSPDWIPAVQFNKPVIYRQKQSITFQVTDTKR